MKLSENRVRAVFSRKAIVSYTISPKKASTFKAGGKIPGKKSTGINFWAGRGKGLSIVMSFRVCSIFVEARHESKGRSSFVEASLPYLRFLDFAYAPLEMTVCCSYHLLIPRRSRVYLLVLGAASKNIHSLRFASFGMGVRAGRVTASC